MIDVGVHYPANDSFCVCGAEFAERGTVIRHAHARGDEILRSATAEEFHQLYVQASEGSWPDSDDAAQRAAASALRQHGGFTDLLRTGLLLSWHPNGADHLSMRTIDFEHAERHDAVTRSDRSFLQILAAMTRHRIQDPWPIDIDRASKQIRPSERRILADAIDEFLLADESRLPYIPLPNRPTIAETSEGVFVDFPALAPSPLAQRQDAAARIRAMFERPADTKANIEQARQYAEKVAAPATPRPAAHLAPAVALLAATAYAGAIDLDRSVQEIAPTEIRRWLAATSPDQWTGDPQPLATTAAALKQAAAEMP